MLDSRLINLCKLLFWLNSQIPPSWISSDRHNIVASFYYCGQTRLPVDNLPKEHTASNKSKMFAEDSSRDPLCPKFLSWWSQALEEVWFWGPQDCISNVLFTGVVWAPVSRASRSEVLVLNRKKVEREVGAAVKRCWRGIWAKSKAADLLVYLHSCSHLQS